MNQTFRITPVTFVLVAVSVGVFALTNWSSSEGLFRTLLIGEPEYSGLQQVGNGEIWRLFTPMFLHFGVLHIVFNMLWTWDLGRLIEARRGSVFYGAFVLALSVASNLAQYGKTGSPMFGGMSGVVYGLLGYVWGQGFGRSDLGFALNRSTVVMMLVWYALCWTGLLGPIANWAHTAGLIVGVGWGYISASSKK
ncbi:MAG: hypothetical protein K0S28_2446 [Paucimonas sp.]|jgi:membrane associated rhomboid family serine protease|nr:hypothetical protein [Paucimonas sp.]